MNVHFTARKTDLTPEVRQYCEKRLKALEKLLGSVLEVDIILSVAKTQEPGGDPRQGQRGQPRRRGRDARKCSTR